MSLPQSDFNNRGNDPLGIARWGEDRINIRVSPDLYVQYLKHTGMDDHYILIVYKSVAYLTNLKGSREMLEVLPYEELLELYRKLEEDIFVFHLYKNDKKLENQLMLFGLDVETVALRKQPQATENQDVIVLKDDIREPLTSKKTLGLTHGWYYPWEIPDIKVDY